MYYSSFVALKVVLGDVMCGLGSVAFEKFARHLECCSISWGHKAAILNLELSLTPGCHLKIVG